MEKVKVPVLIENGVEMVHWGRRRGEFDGILIPQACWAELSCFNRWKKFKPKKVKIVCSRWMDKDHKRVSHWYDMPENTYLMGLRIDVEGESFVYVVVEGAKNNFAEMLLDHIPIFINKQFRRVSLKIGKQ